MASGGAYSQVLQEDVGAVGAGLDADNDPGASGDVTGSVDMVGEEETSGLISRKRQQQQQEAEMGKARKLSRAQRKALREERAEYYSTKMHAAIWVIAAGFAGYYSDFINVCAKSKTVNRFWFNLGLFFFTVATVLVLYMAIWVPRVMKVKWDPEVYNPRMLPITGAACFLCGLFLICGLWPVYGFLTPGLLGLLWMGAIMSAHFLPSI